MKPYRSDSHRKYIYLLLRRKVLTELFHCLGSGTGYLLNANATI